MALFLKKAKVQKKPPKGLGEEGQHLVLPLTAAGRKGIEDAKLALGKGYSDKDVLHEALKLYVRLLRMQSNGYEVVARSSGEEFRVILIVK